MAASEALGIKRLENILFFVNDIERSHRFYRDRVDFACVARSSLAIHTVSNPKPRKASTGLFRRPAAASAPRGKRR